MEDSILLSTKKILSISSDLGIFDLDVITHINSAFSILNQLGVIVDPGFSIEDSSANWTDLGLPLNQLSMVRTYIFLKTRMLFDPPTISFHIDAMDKQIQEFEWRLNVFREETV